MKLSVPGCPTYLDVLINCLGGLSLPRKSVVRSRTDMTNMFTVDVKQQQQQNNNNKRFQIKKP